MTGFEIDKIGEHRIYLGPYPQSKEDVQTLAGNDVTAVLCVQTKVDFQLRQINFEAIQSFYEECNIKLCHYPIKDFDAKDLLGKLQGAIDRLRDLINEGH